MSDRPILRHPEQNPVLERMLQIKRAAGSPERDPRDTLTAEERREVERIIVKLAKRIDDDIDQLSGALFLHAQSRSRLDLMAHMSGLAKGKEAAQAIWRILTPNGDAFADDTTEDNRP